MKKTALLLTAVLAVSLLFSSCREAGRDIFWYGTRPLTAELKAGEYALVLGKSADGVSVRITKPEALSGVVFVIGESGSGVNAAGISVPLPQGHMSNITAIVGMFELSGDDIKEAGGNSVTAERNGVEYKITFDPDGNPTGYEYTIGDGTKTVQIEKFSVEPEE